LATANLPASLTVNSLFPQSPRRTKKDTPRYSVPTFFDLDYYYEASVVPTLRKADEVYPAPITVGGHIAAMFDKTFGVKKATA